MSRETWVRDAQKVWLRQNLRPQMSTESCCVTDFLRGLFLRATGVVVMVVVAVKRFLPVPLSLLPSLGRLAFSSSAFWLVAKFDWQGQVHCPREPAVWTVVPSESECKAAEEEQLGPSQEVFEWEQQHPLAFEATSREDSHYG